MIGPRKISWAADLAILAAVRWWCRFSYPRLCSRTLRRSRKLPDPATPTSDIDKFLWRKIFDHNPMFTSACDKLAAKEYALSICPELNTAEVFWVGTDPELIPDDVLFGNVVIKANHGSRWNRLVHDGTINRGEMCKEASFWVKRTYGRAFSEWGYRSAAHCILVEEMLCENGKRVATEYKFHVSGGKTAYVMVAWRDERGETHNYYFNREGQLSQAPPGVGDSLPAVKLPPCFGRMRDIAERLAKPFDYIRVDLYELNGKVFFSELTVYPLSGQGGGSPALRALRNAMWDLRQSWFLTTTQTGWRGIYAGALRRWLNKQKI